MWITDISIRRPLTILMAVLGLVVLGYQSVKRMPVDLYPKVDIPYVSIITVYRGAGAQEIETLVSKPLEEAVASVNKVKNVTSSSQEGVSVVICEFLVGADLEVAASDIRDRLDMAKSDLPDNADTPIMYKIDLNAEPIMYIGMSGDRPPREIKKLADDVVKDRLGKVDGAASVSVSGGETREIFVQVDQKRLEAHGFNILEITQAIATANLNIPAGNIKQGRREYTVRVVGEFADPAELQGIKIRHQDPRFPGAVELKDIATVLDTSAERKDFTRLYGNDSVGIVVQKQADANTVKVADQVREELKKLKQELPPDIKMDISRDNSIYIKESLHDVTMHLFEGALLATLVVFLFLHIFRATFIVLLAIPTSIMATFLPIAAFGFTLNMMTLMGLALCVGILVDDSIVVLENIFRHLGMGKKPAQAALDGRMEIGAAAVAITLTDVVVFVPIAFMGGIVGQFFRQFGITVATATLFSLVMSFTLTPMLAARWLKTQDAHAAEGGGPRRKGFWGWFAHKFDRFFTRIDNTYRGTLRWSLRHRWTVIFGGFLFMIFSVIFVIKMGLGFEFFPKSDNGQFDVSLEMPVGANVDETDRITKKFETIIMDKKKYPEVESVFTTVGEISSRMGAGETGPNYASIMVRLNDKAGLMERLRYRINKKAPKGKRLRSVWDVEDQLRKDLAVIPGPKNYKVETTSQSGPSDAPIKLELTGANTQQIVTLSEKIKSEVESVKGTRDLEISWKIGRPEIQVKVDRDKASQIGLSVAQIAMTLRNSIEGDNSSKYREYGSEYDIRIRLDEADRRTLEDVRNTMLAGAMGKNIRLKDVASVTHAQGPVKLERKNRQRLITITGNLSQGFTLGNVNQQIKKKIDALSKPAGINIFYAGEAQHMAESNQSVGSALLLAVLLVYMLMVALFESLLYPFIIMFTLPQALVGALWGLFLTHKSLSMISMIGIIMLMGLVTKNAILLIDYTNTLRKRGMKRDDAIIEAGPVRLRPILMTTLTIILGNMPIALGLGSGSEMRSPMSVAVIGGLTLSLLLTLVMIPCTYTIFDDISNFISRLLGRKPAEFQTADETSGPAAPPSALT